MWHTSKYVGASASIYTSGAVCALYYSTVWTSEDAHWSIHRVTLEVASQYALCQEPSLVGSCSMTVPKDPKVSIRALKMMTDDGDKGDQ